ncbi:hypothetical protein HZS_57 [Henneguya salminicola]|nr:hypothetical protein HZS_57 [Henneguya salminicola]
MIKPTREAIVNLISNRRKDQGSGDIYRQVGNGFPSFHRLLLWSSGFDPLSTRCRRVQAYLDATFISVLKPFKQCIILMVYNNATELYIPVVYALVDNKKLWTYLYFLHLVFVFNRYKI